MEKEYNGEDNSLVFTRMPADGFDNFMADPELVIAVVENMGFGDKEEISKLALEDMDKALQVLEGFGQGEWMSFGFENCWASFLDKFPQDKILKMIVDEGRNTQIYTEYGEIRVLSQSQVVRASEGLSKLELVDGSPSEMGELMVEACLPGVQNFFSIAAGLNEFVLVSRV